MTHRYWQALGMPATLTGIDGYPGGWVAARLIGSDIDWRACAEGEFSTLVADITAVDMPIGLMDSGWRECDRLARHLLAKAGSRVFMTPPRSVVELGLSAPNEVVQEESRRTTGQGVSRQALGLATRILVVDDYVTRHPEALIREVHPELSFLALAGRVLDSKKTATGVAQRLLALGTWRTDIIDALGRAPDGVPIDDCLDALACLWSAERIQQGIAETLPTAARTAPHITY